MTVNKIEIAITFRDLRQKDIPFGSILCKKFFVKFCDFGVKTEFVIPGIKSTSIPFY